MLASACFIPMNRYEPIEAILFQRKRKGVRLARIVFIFLLRPRIPDQLYRTFNLPLICPQALLAISDRRVGAWQLFLNRC